MDRNSNHGYNGIIQGILNSKNNDATKTPTIYWP